MIAFILAAAALTPAAPTALDAERAFIRDAQRSGQWAAFRKTAARDAVMFTPKVTWARDFLKGRKDPKSAARWWSAASVTSCDGTVAVNGGPYVTGDGRNHGRFTTVWLKGSDGWRWIYDGSEATKAPLPARRAPIVRRASCSGKPGGAPIASAPTLATPPAPDAEPNDFGRGESGDRTLGWDWKVEADGTRTFRLFQWTGRRYAQVIHQRIAP